MKTVTVWPRTLCWILVLLLAPRLVGTASGQTVAEAIHEATEAVTVGPAGPGPAVSSQVVLEGGQANNQAELWLRVGNVFRLGLSAPASKSTKATDFASLDALADKLTLKAGLRIADFGLSDRTDATVVADAQKKTCDKWGLPESTNCDSGVLEMHLERQGRSGREVSAALREFDRASFDGRLIWVVGIEGKLARSEHEYFMVGGATDDEDRTSGALAASIGAVYGPGVVSFRLAFENTFADAKQEVEKCSPLEQDSTLVACKSLPFGAPAESEDVVVRGELRHIFGLWAIAPTVAWNPESDEDVVGISMPIYFVPSSTGQLVGGVRFSWRSDVRDLGLSVFLTKPLAGL